MKIVVCIKHVPSVKTQFDREKNLLNRKDLPGTINPNDRIAIRYALEMRGAGDEVIALSMGPPNAEESLREAIAMGVDRGVLLSDRRFAEADTLATSYTLHCAVRKIGGAGMVLCGSRSVDSETGHVGPQLAEHLGLPLLTYVRSIRLNGGTVTAERICDNFIETLEAELPVLVTITHTPAGRIYPSLAGLSRAFDEGEVTLWDADAVGADPSRIGRDGSPTWVRRILTPEKQRMASLINDDRTGATVRKLCEMLRDRNILLMDKIRSERSEKPHA
jgi:electron transfer flavoprotein beta subunit